MTRFKFFKSVSQKSLHFEIKIKFQIKKFFPETLINCTNTLYIHLKFDFFAMFWNASVFFRVLMVARKFQKISY